MKVKIFYLRGGPEQWTGQVTSGNRHGAPSPRAPISPIRKDLRVELTELEVWHSAWLQICMLIRKAKQRVNRFMLVVDA